MRIFKGTKPPTELVFRKSASATSKLIIIPCPPHVEYGMDPDLEKRLGIKKKTLYRLFYNRDEQDFFCFNYNRDDRWTDPIIKFPFHIPLDRVLRVWEIIADTWPMPPDPFARINKIPPECKFSRWGIVGAIIDEFSLGVSPYEFFTEKHKGNEPYYAYPLLILQAMDRLYHGSANYRLT